MTTAQKAYIAGFLDGDGSIMLQLKPRNDTRFLFRAKTLIIFYQDVSHVDILYDLKDIIGAGYVYKRNDRISELRIEGFVQVKNLLCQIRRYIRFKQKQVEYMLRALKILQRRYEVEDFLLICKFSDKISECNYSSKHRKYNMQAVLNVLKKHNLVPVTTGSPSFE